MTEDFAYRAKVLITQRRYQDAVRLCRRGLLTDPTRVEGRLVLGMALLAMRRFEEVRAEMVALLRARPEDAVAHRLLGEAYLKAGDLVRAEEELRAALKLSPDDRVVAERLEELKEVREADPPVESNIGPWLDAAEFGTVSGPSEAGRPAEEFDDATMPDTGQERLKFEIAKGLPAVITEVLAPAASDRMRRASVLLATDPGSAGSAGAAGVAPTIVAASAQPLGGITPVVAVEPIVAAAEAAARAQGVTPGALDDDASTDWTSPVRLDSLRGAPPARTVDVKRGATSAAGAGTAAEPEDQGTVTPVMPALVRAAARLAAAGRPASPLLGGMPPLAGGMPEPARTAPAPAPDGEVDTRSYAEVSGEGRGKDGARQSDRSLLAAEVLAAQARFAAAMSEISEVSESDKDPKAAASAVSQPDAGRGRRASGVQPVAAEARGAPDDEVESTITEVPQSHREGGAPRPATPKPAVEAPAPRSAGQDPETVIERPVGGGAGLGAAPAASPAEQAARVISPAAPWIKPTSRPAMAPVTVAPVPERPERPERVIAPSEPTPQAASPALAARVTVQPPSFLDTPPRVDLPPSRRAGGGAAFRSVASVATASPKGSASPSPMQAAGRITVPVLEAPPAAGPGTVPPPPVRPLEAPGRQMVTALIRDSEDSLAGGPKAAPAAARQARDLAESAVATERDSALDSDPGSLEGRGVWSGTDDRAPGFIPPSRSPTIEPYDPLDRPLSPEEFARSDEGSYRSDEDRPSESSLTPGTSDAGFLTPEDLVSGSRQVSLPPVGGAGPDRANPLDEPISPDDFSYAPDRGRSLAGQPAAAPAPAAGASPLDQPLSPDDWSYPGPASKSLPAEDVRARPAAPKPLVGPAPKMSIPSAILRQPPKLMPTPPPEPAFPANPEPAPEAERDPLDQPLHPSEFGKEVPSGRGKGARRAEAPARGGAQSRPSPKSAPARVMPRQGGQPARVAGKPVAKERPRTFSRTLPYAITGAALAILVALGVWALLRWRTHREQLQKIEQAESAEAVGDYTSLRQALLAYRELAERSPDNREYVARLARTYSSLAFEFGLAEDERDAQTMLQRLAQMGPPDPLLGHIDAAARGYLLAAGGRLDEAQAELRNAQVPDPNVVYLLGRIAVMQQHHAEAVASLRGGMTAFPSWVRISCALVEAMLGVAPNGADWIQLLDGLASGPAGRRHVGVRLLRARLYAARPQVRSTAREELTTIAGVVLWNQAAPSEQAWVHLLKASLDLSPGGLGPADAERELLLSRDARPARDWRFRVLFARVLRGLHRLAEARAELSEIAAAPGLTRSEARLLLAETYLDLGEIDLADQTLAQVDETPRLHLLKGRVLMVQRKSADALREFLEAKRRDPNLTFEVDLESARALITIGNTTQAVQTAQELARTHPGEVEVQLLLGDAQLVVARPDLAESAYQQALAIAPDSVEARMSIARLRRGKGDFEGAKRALSEILQRDDDNVEALLLLASIAGESGNLEEARQKLQTVESVAQRSAGGALAIAQAELALHGGRLEGVTALITQAEQGGAPESELKRIKGRFLLQTYQIQEALSALRRAADLDPGDPIRAAVLARAYRLSKDGNRDAARAADRALAIDRLLADALVVKAMIAMDEGNLGGAQNLLRDADRALAGRPRDQNVRAFVKMAQGRIDYEYGLFDSAMTKLQSALELDAAMAEAFYFQGLVYQDLGRSREACDAFTRYLTAAPNTPDAPDAQSQKRRVCR